jgi:hypothetical protein
VKRATVLLALALSLAALAAAAIAYGMAAGHCEDDR